MDSEGGWGSRKNHDGTHGGGVLEAGPRGQNFSHTTAIKRTFLYKLFSFLTDLNVNKIYILS